MAETSKTALFPAADPKVLYIVDISGYVFRAYHALPPLSSPDGEPTHAVLGVTSMLLKLITEQRPAMLAVAMDSRTKSFRHELYDAYKANRPKPPEDLKQQMARVSEVVDAYGIPVLQKDGVEADDVIATAVAQARGLGLSVVIVSADKDLLQLVGPDVLMYDTGRNAVFGVPETEKKMGVGPALVRDYLALVGDSSDNVPGVPSVGPKTAVKLLQDYGDFEGIFEHVDEVPKAGLKKKLQEHREQAFLSRDLVTLKSDVDIKVDPEALKFGGEDLGRLRHLFTELGFTRLLAQLGDGQGAEAPAQAVPDEAAVEARLVDDEPSLSALGQALSKAKTFLFYTVSDGRRPLGSDLVGMGFLIDGTAHYVPLGHRGLGTGNQHSPEALSKVIAAPLSDAKVEKTVIDAKREHQACAELGIQLSGVTHDVGLASYLLDPDRHAHSLSEVRHALFGEPLPSYDALTGRVKATPPSERSVEEVMAAVAESLQTARACAAQQVEGLAAEGQLAHLLAELELPLSRVLADVERTGIRCDASKLKQLSQKAAESLVALEKRCVELAGHEFNVASPRQLETILFDELELPVIKKTKTARSTDQSVLEELSAMHELPSVILEHRMLAKLKSTYLDALPREIAPRTGRIHTDFRQTVAATGRLSSSDPNLQNIPIRSEFGRQIREAFVPRDGYSMFSADYSQIELRVLAHISEDEELLSAFREGEDVHVRTAKAIFGVDAAGVTRDMRGQAKTVNFAVIYGQTQFALARNLRISRAEAGRYIKAFFDKYAGVARYMERVVEAGREEGLVRTLSGRIRRIPELRSQNRMKREAAERVARNTPIQGTAADIIKRAMIDVFDGIAEQKMAARMLLTVHDELVFEAPQEEQEALEKMVVARMQGAMALKVPLLVECGWGASWGEAH